MKNLIKYVSLASLPILLFACRKDDTNNHDNHDGHDHVHSSMSFHINHKFGNQTFHLDSTYELSSGTKVKISRVEFYLSNSHTLTMENEQIDNYGRKYLLVKSDIAHYELGDADFSMDHLHKLSLNVGVDSVANHSDPTTYDASHPLALQTPTMHWSWNSGYRFLVLTGQADTNNDGVFENDFDYHIGTDAYLVEDTLHLHKNITTAGLMIPLNVNYEKLFDNLDLTSELITHTMNNPAIATKIKANMEEFISVE